MHDHRTPVAEQGEEKKEATLHMHDHMTPVAEQGEEKKEEEEEEGEKCHPIPGATGKNTKPSGKSEKCREGGFGCHRSCKYLVEEDKCGDCREHNATQPKPEEQIEKFQKQLGKVRIPKATDSIGWVSGCKKRNAVKCKDQEGKEHCCCNLGFIFDFASRECIADTEDKANKEDPIPGSQLWGKTKGPSEKCLHHGSKYCCHRSCNYELDKDKCGHCESYDQPITSVEHMIRDWHQSNDAYIIPPAISKPRLWGWSSKCSGSVKHASKCDDSSMKDHCCCTSGLVFSFESRKCVTSTELKEEQDKEYKAEQEYDQAVAAEESHQGPPPDPQPQYSQNQQQHQQQHQQPHQQANQNGGGGGGGEAAKMLTKTAIKASGYGSAATHSLALVVPMLALSMMRGLI